MIEVQYGVVRIKDRWTVISQGLRFGSYDSEAQAEQVARRMADQAAGLPVQLHIQDELGALRREVHEAVDGAPEASASEATL